VTYKFPQSTAEVQQQELMDECRKLESLCGGKEAGIMSMAVTPNLDPRKGFTWVEVVLFEDVEALIRFHGHPAHQHFAQQMAAVADVWVVADINVGQGTEIN
jgi:hypothetical protein